ncbi:MAG: hypothetical protein D8M22_08005 [Armatimonadetes bacterium]|nr:hypothetical protein [Armatimonadota bacterium]
MLAQVLQDVRVHEVVEPRKLPEPVVHVRDVSVKLAVDVLSVRLQQLDLLDDLGHVHFRGRGRIRLGRLWLWAKADDIHAVVILAIARACVLANVGDRIVHRNLPKLQIELSHRFRARHDHELQARLLSQHPSRSQHIGVLQFEVDPKFRQQLCPGADGERHSGDADQPNPT